MDAAVVDLPLPALFKLGQEIHQRASNSQIDEDEVRKGCSILKQCSTMVDKLALYSANEEIDDISTGDLKYILVNFYLGELSEKVSSDERLQVIKTAQLYLKEFISSCERFGLLPDMELQALIQEGPVSAETRRAIKIARFKRLREAETKLQEMKERKERRKRSSQAAAKASVVEYGDEEDTIEEFSEEEREAWLTQISIAMWKAIDLMEMLKLEEKVVALKTSQNAEEMKAALDERATKADEWHRNAASKVNSIKPPQPITCATFAQDVIEGRARVSQSHDHTQKPLLFGPASVVGGSMLTERQRLAAQVFQPSHRLPTMSIEDAGMKEMEIMTKWTERNAKLQEEANSSWTNDGKKKSNDSDDEEGEYKARAWDDWKDENPRGSGNKKLTPTG